MDLNMPLVRSSKRLAEMRYAQSRLGYGIRRGGGGCAHFSAQMAPNSQAHVFENHPPAFFELTLLVPTIAERQNYSVELQYGANSVTRCG